MDRPCLEHMERLVAVEDRATAVEAEQVEQRALLRDLRSSSRTNLVATVATPIGAVAVAAVAGWFALAQSREQGRQQAAEKAAQVSLDVSSRRSLEAQEQAITAALARQREEFQRWELEREQEHARAEEHRVAASKRKR